MKKCMCAYIYIFFSLLRRGARIIRFAVSLLIVECLGKNCEIGRTAQSVRVGVSVLYDESLLLLISLCLCFISRENTGQMLP